MVLLLATAAAAQSRCEVTLRIFEFKEDGSTENFPVTDADVTITTNGQKKPIRPKLKEGQLVATLKPSVGYAIEIGKPGFMTTKDTVECYADESADPVSPIFFIWAGDPKLIRKRVVASGKRNPKLGEAISPGKKGEEVTLDMSRPLPVTTTSGADSSTRPLPKVISGGIVNGKAANLVKPPYPAAARAVRASGAVYVQVTIDELGYVVEAAAVSGHPLLRTAAVKAARESKFATTMLGGYPVKVTGIIVYNFQP